jgi:hypothetical protein
MLWLAYSFHKLRQPKLRTAIREHSGLTPNHPQPNALLPVRYSARWSFINKWEPQAQHDDRPPMSGFVEPRNEATPSGWRAFARQSHQLMYKKWSQDRHD